MKIAYGSDLHLEFGEYVPETFPDADILVLAGDIVIVNKLNFHAYDFFNRVSSFYKKVIVIAGNHEHYKGRLDESIDLYRTSFKHLENVIILDNETYEYEDVIIFGGTMWTNYNNSPWEAEIARGAMNDFRLIKVTDTYRSMRPVDSLFEFNKFKRNLYELVENVDSDKKIVVISHHGPSMLSIDERFAGDPLNSAFVVDMSDFMLDYENINFWFHGHIHVSKDYQMGNTRVLCNPRGYPNEHKDFSSYEFKVVEI